MLEVISSPFMQKAFMAGILVSLLTGLISVFIVLRKMSFIGAGISHAAFGGVAIGFFTGLNPLFTAIIYSIAVAIGIESTGRKGRISEDVSIGIFYSVSMALGVALVSLSKAYNVDLFGYLFGNILAITQTDIVLTIVTFILVSGFILIFLKDLFLAAYNEELAQISGVRVVFLKNLFLISLAVSIVISIRIVGIILVSALLVIPGATARLFARGLVSMIVLSCLTGVVSVISGLLISYKYDVAPGASIVLASAFIFFLSLVLKKKK
ncbi:MAG: metal ABC transporter permease [Thermodesulfovibrionales bacterium]